MLPGMPGGRRALAAGVAVLLLLAVAALIVTRDDSPQRLTAGGAGASTTLALETTTSTPAVTDPPTTPAQPTTTTSGAPAPTAATTAPTAPSPTSGPRGQQLETEAGGHGPVAAALARARAAWAAAKPPRGYTWRYDNECFCSPRKLEVTVDGAGAVTSVRALDGSSPPQPTAALTVEGAFAELQSAIEADAASIRVRFDERRGLPLAFYIDRSRMIADEEHGITLIEFTPRS